MTLHTHTHNTLTKRLIRYLYNKTKNLRKQNNFKVILFSVLFSFLGVSIITFASTTINENINTGGTLTVSGNATLGDDSTDLIKSLGSFYASSTLQATGAVRFYSTIRIDGATTLNGVSYTWPSSDGSASTYLQTNGAGTLSWATVSSGSSPDWLKQTNFGVLNLTASTTIPYWAKDAIYASSTLQVQGLTTLANATTSLLTVSNGAWFTGGNIGIGTTTPNWLLQVAGTRPFFTLSDTGAAANNKHWFLSSQGGNFYVGTSSDAYATSTVSKLTILSNGNVGIGTTTPQAQFAIQGNTYFAGNVGIGTAVPRGLLNLRGYVGGADASAVAAFNETLVIGGTFNQTYNSGNAVLLHISDYSNDEGDNVYPIYVEDENNNVAFYINGGASGSTGTAYFNGKVGIGTTTPTEQLSVSGRLFVGGTGTSTIQNNLYVMGTLRSTVSYVGDLIFSNNFKFIETPRDAKIQSLFLQNQYGENILKINEKGQIMVKEIEAEKGKFRNNLQTEKLQIGSSQNRMGITIYDKKTGEPVCVFSENNILKLSKGECT